ncbi:MAG: hypothetical protein Q9227_002776 [Pyrenula ochraceoflavens]
MVIRHLHPQQAVVDLLILGAGWTSQFLIPLLTSSHISFAATTTDGRDGTIPFKFDPESESETPYEALPTARTILITFPLKGNGPSKLIMSLYNKTHKPAALANGIADRETPLPHFQWIQLGSTHIFTDPHWNTHTSPTNLSDSRAVAELEFLSLGHTCVLNLAGLYGGQRDPRHWIPRIARSKDEVRGKKALHLIHGVDVAQGIVAAHRHFNDVGNGKRWLLTDLRVYDWWDLISTWGAEAQDHVKEKEGLAAAQALPYTKWVGELLRETGARALPRGPEELGRVLDSGAFWEAAGVWPQKGRV